jgi:hypothetical protein
MLPFRSFSAYYTFDDIRKINTAAAILYQWACNVDEAYKMTNKEEFAPCQELMIIFAA